jgi:hypothetical protein
MEQDYTLYNCFAGQINYFSKNNLKKLKKEFKRKNKSNDNETFDINIFE